MDHDTHDDRDFLVGRAIAGRRAERGLSRRALAQAVGLSASTLSRIEAGRRRATDIELAACARILAVPVAALAAERPFPHAAAEGPPPDPRRRTRDAHDREALLRAVDDAESIFQRIHAQRSSQLRPFQSLPAYAGLTDPPGTAQPQETPASEHERSSPPAPRRPEWRRPEQRRPGEIPGEVGTVIADWFALRALATDNDSGDDRGRSGSGLSAALGCPPERRPRRRPARADEAGTAGAAEHAAGIWRQKLRVDPCGPLPDLVPLLEGVAHVEVAIVRLGAAGPACGALRRDRVPFIFVNAARPVVLQRFALAHAFGHLALGDDDIVDERLGTDDQTDQEGAADRFAAELLAPLAAVADWYRRHGRRAPDLRTLVALGNAFGIEVRTALERSHAAGALGRRREATLSAEVRSRPGVWLARQALLGGLNDTLATVAAAAAPAGDNSPPAVLRVPGRMRSWAFAATAAGKLSVNQAASVLHRDPSALAGELTRAGLA